MARVSIYRSDGGLHRSFESPEAENIEIKTEDSGRFSVLLVTGHGYQLLGNYGPEWGVTLDGVT